ncbi:hypothetical protein F7725_015256 [Dissostichus mawsoni]|uniref:B box-type domain-containing protein n=1 Tax=Dissostichus mawsoni TaxID=36200 RepID=A0A7J5YIZ9_DISMA|nr:hypothetical protein F7725_015256 [Dissostichus mawsoni]
MLADFVEELKEKRKNPKLVHLIPVMLDLEMWDCRVSFCEQHLQPHYEVPFKKHKLIEASKLQENICSQHDMVMEIFCLTDQQVICSLCLNDEHKEHDIVSAAAEMSKKKKELGVSQQNIQQRIQYEEKL